MLIEAGDRKAALQLARQREWIQEGIDYCSASRSVAGIPRETVALLAMLAHPKGADCLLSTGMNLTESGLANLARIVLSGCLQNCSAPEVRKKAEVFLRYRLPAREAKKLAESLNAVGYNLHYSYKQPQEAIEAYKKAIAADPSFPWPYHNIGQVYRKEGKDVQALEWYQKAVAINPHYWKAQINLGAILLDLKRYEEALVAYRQAAAVNPDDTDSRQKIKWLSAQLPGNTEVRATLPGSRAEPTESRHPGTPGPASQNPSTESSAAYGWWNVVVPLLAGVSLLLLARVRLSALPAAETPTPYARLVRHGAIDAVPDEISFTQDEMLIGQGEECDVIIPHASIAHEHARVKKCKQGYVLFDLKSQTGTYVNDRPIVENLLKDGMRVRIGEVEFTFSGAHEMLPQA
ncbi:MAG: tetratricopeptide repeat protein [Candidatus Binatia bacterium]